MSTFNVKVEYDMIPIRHIAIECPKCKKWFRGWEITDDDLSEHGDIYYATFTCPLCHKKFGFDPSSHGDSGWLPTIEESCHPEIYKDCLSKREIWE